ncbi:MAG: hypothetical protein MGU50_05165 [Trichodesmium sp. MAG_R02]|nr:hypothetical protein [Trichodesmium sp. MAG_R02]
MVRWEQDGKINAIKTPSAQRRYDIDYYIQRMSDALNKCGWLDRECLWMSNRRRPQ